MRIIKFRQIKTNQLIYVVTGANSEDEAYRFVCNYKKMNFTDYLLNFKTVRGKFVRKNNEYKLYTTNLNEINGKNCYAITRDCVDLNPMTIYA